MKELDLNSRYSQIGLILLALGVLALLSNFGIFGGVGTVIGAALFAGGGVWLFRRYGQGNGRTFVLLAAFALFAVAGAMIGGSMSGPLFLGVLGLGFVALYTRDTERWWAIIPAGALLSLALVAALDTSMPGGASGSILFVGLAATFALLTRLPHHPQRWAIYPALALAVVAVLALSSGDSWLLPLLLIGSGVYVLSRRGMGLRPEGRGPVGSGSTDSGPTASGPDGSPGSATTSTDIDGARIPAVEWAPAPPVVASTPQPPVVESLGHDGSDETRAPATVPSQGPVATSVGSSAAVTGSQAPTDQALTEQASTQQDTARSPEQDPDERA